VTHTTFQELLLTPFTVLEILGFEILSQKNTEILFRAEESLRRGWEKTNFVELWSVSRPRLAEMAIDIWVMCQLTEKLFETSSVR